jgi:rubredoxin
MGRQTHTVSINFTGGIISPGYLQEALKIAEAAKVTEVRFGLRQQLLIDVPVKHFRQFSTQCKQQKIQFHEPESCHNITSSYPAAGIFTSGNSWLSEGDYKDVFDLFDYTPTLKLNICDSHQTFVPFFTGHINWIASEHPHYWYLFVRFQGSSQLLAWPELIYTNEISRLSRHIENLQTSGVQEDKLYERTKVTLEYMGRPLSKELELPNFHLPYYEGFNRYNNSYWLGIYRRDELFPLPFLQDICAICLETKTGQLYATPWKSIIIKNIDPAHRPLWDYVLGKYRINVRHAANELNWQVEDHSEDCLVLKRHVIRYFDKEDVRTYGLCFSVHMQSAASEFGSVVIRRQENKYGSKLKYMHRYDILYTQGFNPNSSTLVLYREHVSKEHLGPYLVSLCKEFYEKASEADPLQDLMSSRQTVAHVRAPERKVHQCSQCLSVYDEALGEPEQGIEPGTAFNDLPPGFGCALCGADVNAFDAVSESVLGC